jgi:hypothetical protein
MTAPILFFLGIYLSQNFLVNSLDYLLYKRHHDELGYYDDADFLKSFSYKSHQAFITVLFALLFGQSFSPSHPVITNHPSLLFRLFFFTMPACILMLLTFLLELTSETPDVRSQLYRTELAKIFFTVCHFYLLSMIYSNWL